MGWGNESYQHDPFFGAVWVPYQQLRASLQASESVDDPDRMADGLGSRREMSYRVEAIFVIGPELHRESDVAWSVSAHFALLLRLVHARTARGARHRDCLAGRLHGVSLDDFDLSFVDVLGIH